MACDKGRGARVASRTTPCGPATRRYAKAATEPLADIGLVDHPHPRPPASPQRDQHPHVGVPAQEPARPVDRIEDPGQARWCRPWPRTPRPEWRHRAAVGQHVAHRACSAARSASVTGSKSARLLVATRPWARKCGRIAARAASARAWATSGKAPCGKGRGDRHRDMKRHRADLRCRYGPLNCAASSHAQVNQAASLRTRASSNRRRRCVSGMA